MSSTSFTETATTNAKTLNLPTDDQPHYKKIPGGFEIQAKGSKWFTSTVPNTDYVPPKDFTFPRNTSAVAVNPVGPTEIPQKLSADYINVQTSSVWSYI
jgi:hypothetical protein